MLEIVLWQPPPLFLLILDQSFLCAVFFCLCYEVICLFFALTKSFLFLRLDSTQTYLGRQLLDCKFEYQVFLICLCIPVLQAKTSPRQHLKQSLQQ